MKKSDLKKGMIVTLRRGVERIIIRSCLFDEDGITTSTLNCYNDDLTYINNCTNEDIMKIEYGGKVIWERVDWNKVPFGTKVRAWDCNEDDKVVGRFLYYKEGYEYPYLVFIESEEDVISYRYCEIIKEGEDE